MWFHKVSYCKNNGHLYSLNCQLYVTCLIEHSCIIQFSFLSHHTAYHCSPYKLSQCIICIWLYLTPPLRTPCQQNFHSKGHHPRPANSKLSICPHNCWSKCLHIPYKGHCTQNHRNGPSEYLAR